MGMRTKSRQARTGAKNGTSSTEPAVASRVDAAPAPPHQRPTRTLPAEIYTREETQSVLTACSRRGAAGVRNRALIGLLYRCGLRIGEAVALKPADIDHATGTVRVLRGKGSKARTVGIDAGALALIDQWLAKRAALGIRSGPLFCTFSKNASGRPLDSSYVRHLLPRLREKAQVTKRVHAHGFRHTHAVELLREGASPVLIQGALGHSNVAVTNTYLAHLEPQEIVQWQRNRSW